MLSGIWTLHQTRFDYSPGKLAETHVFPFIGSRDITSLKTPDLLVPVKATEAKEIYEIASRLQQCISAIMRYAAQSGIK
ncbi:phage integrase central domain-containing protein [Yersinia massiliensis]|uniref:phage integrase central domain-containing protein n=1 Tax=Yersinia massiliensis TaxID=419257 RepID=UPI003703ECC8